jgi:hypothetical protein
MAITKLSGRQEALTGRADFALADLVSGSAVAAVNLPANARVIDVILRIDTAFNSGTTDALVIQNNEGTPKAFITISAGAGAVAVGGYRTAATNLGYKHTTPKTIDVKWTGAGTAATTGAGTVLVTYVIDNKAEVSQD